MKISQIKDVTIVIVFSPFNWTVGYYVSKELNVIEINIGPFGMRVWGPKNGIY